MSAKYSRAEILTRLVYLIETADAVAEAWEQGDLAMATNELNGAAQEARDMLKNMRGELRACGLRVPK